MILDKQNLLSDDQAVTVTAASENIIDLGNDAAEIQALNEKGKLEVLAQVTEAFTGATNMKVGIQTSDSSTFSSATTLLETAEIAEASLVAGYQFKFGGLPVINEQYLRLYYTVTGTHSAGTIVAGLVLDRQTNAV